MYIFQAVIHFTIFIAIIFEVWSMFGSNNMAQGQPELSGS